jgi:1-acyl-sn-glycerol-3-phosphate acyltransferase
VWKLRSVLISAPAIIAITTFMGTISLITSLWDKAGRAQHRLAEIWSGWLLNCAFVGYKVTGTEKIDPKGTYVLVSNHESFMDIPSVLAVLPVQIRFFAKKGLFSIPFIGWHLKRSGHLEVARGDARASLKSMSEGARLIRERNISVLLFPEGGRSNEGLQPFKEGAAYIAIKAGVPIVPIGLVNTGNILPMHTLLLRPGNVEIHVGDPIETAGMTIQDRGRLSALLHDKVAELSGQSTLVGVN